MKKYLFFSDFHLGCCDKVDNFKEKEEDFWGFLRWKNYKQEITKTYVLGDTFELWQGGLFSSGKKRLKKIRKRYNGIYHTIKMFNLLAGNHDWAAKKELNMKEMEIIDLKKETGYRILALHGHQFDEQYKNKLSVKIARVATEIWGVFEGWFGVKKMTKFLSDIEKEKKKIKEMKRKKSPSKNKEMEDEYIKKAIAFAKKKKCNIVVMGHTHNPKIYYDKKKKIYYVNTGSWAELYQQNFVLIDFDKMIIKIYNFDLTPSLITQKKLEKIK